MKKANLWESLEGRVIRECKNGILLRLETGELAFASFCGVKLCDRVLCTVSKIIEDRNLILVNVDSALEENLMAA